MIGSYHSAVSATASQIRLRSATQFPSCARISSSPNLQRRGLKFFFRASPHDEMFSQAMFDMFDNLRKKDEKIETLALFHEERQLLPAS